MYSALKNYLAEVTGEFELVPAERKAALNRISEYIRRKINNGETARLTFICTHNSRRSHFGQVWAKVAADYYGFGNLVETFSGGTEVSACNPRTIRALKHAGLKVMQSSGDINPHYLVRFADAGPVIECYSKLYDDPGNPSADFAAIMTCSHAEENCPFIPGASLRVSVTYEDPKMSDDTPEESMVYDQRCREICREVVFIFKQVSTRK